MSDRLKGFILGSIAASTYGMNPLFALPLYADGMNVDLIGITVFGETVTPRQWLGLIQ